MGSDRPVNYSTTDGQKETGGSCSFQIHEYTTNALRIRQDTPGMGWQSKDCTSCLLLGMSCRSFCTPSTPWTGFPFQTRDEDSR